MSSEREKGGDKRMRFFSLSSLCRFSEVSHIHICSLSFSYDAHQVTQAFILEHNFTYCFSHSLFDSLSFFLLLNCIIFRHLIQLFLLRDTLQWCIVCAMIIVFLLFLYIHAGHSQIPIKTPNLMHNCSFLNNLYLSNAAVSDQFQFNNSTSIKLIASYTFQPASFTLSTFEFGLIYQFSTSNYLVPFPVVFDCAPIVQSCQLKTMKSSAMASRGSEPIRVQLTSFNYTSPSTKSQFNQMGLYLKQGRYQLSNCTLSNGKQMTDPNTVFHIQIQYEKSVGKFKKSLIVNEENESNLYVD